MRAIEFSKRGKSLIRIHTPSLFLEDHSVFSIIS